MTGYRCSPELERRVKNLDYLSRRGDTANVRLEAEAELKQIDAEQLERRARRRTQADRAILRHLADAQAAWDRGRKDIACACVEAAELVDYLFDPLDYIEAHGAPPAVVQRRIASKSDA